MSFHQRQQHAECTTVPDLALHLDPSAMRGHDVMRQGESQTGSADGLYGGYFSSYEPLENVRLFGIRDAEPTITYPDDRVAVLPPHIYTYLLTFGRVLHGVVQ